MFHFAKNEGFTLLEMIVSLVIFSLIGVLTHQLLTSSLDVNERILERYKVEDSLRKLFLVVHDDFENMLPRTRFYNNSLNAAFYHDEIENSFSFVRGGYGNYFSESNRARIVKVKYFLGVHPDRNNKESPYYLDDRQYLLRMISTKIDNENNQEDSFVVQPLLANIKTFNLLPLFRSGGAVLDKSIPVLPKSIIIEMEGLYFGSLSYTIMVR